MSWLARSGNAKEIEILVPVIRRMRELKPEFVAALNNTGFFANFCPVCMEVEDGPLPEASIMLLDKIARIAWTDGFKHFIGYIPKLFRKGGAVAQKALIASLVLARYNVAKELLLESEFVEALGSCHVAGSYQAYKQDLLGYLTGTG
jgi:hypothetical protein